MILNSVSINATLRVRHVSGGEEQWDKILDLLSATTESAILKGFTDLFFFDFPNGSLLGKNISEDLNITDKLIGMGDGSTTEFNFTLTPYPVKPSSVAVYYTVGGNDYTASDDGNGAITGTELDSGSVTYEDGSGSLSFTTAPDNGTPIKANFIRGIASDDALLTGFKFVLALDENPSLNDNPFSSIVPLTLAPTKVDWYQTEDSHIYRITMVASYTDINDAGPVTAVGIVYQGVEGTPAGTSEKEIYVLKSISPFKTDLYGSDGLILSNQCDITVDLQIVSRK